MLELVPIDRDGESYNICGYTRNASEAFNSEWALRPASSSKNKHSKNKKKTITVGVYINGRQIFVWLGSATLLLALAITFNA